MITINIDKAKPIGHEIRREKRAGEFAPLDKAIAMQIPGMDTSAIEAARQEIRDKYAAIQGQIDGAESVEALTAIVQAMS